MRISFTVYLASQKFVSDQSYKKRAFFFAEREREREREKSYFRKIE